MPTFKDYTMDQLQLPLSFEDFIPENHLREIDNIVAQENRIYLDDDLEELGENSQDKTLKKSREFKKYPTEKEEI